MKVSMSKWRKPSKFVALIDIILSGIRTLGSITFAGWTIYKTMMILVKISDHIPPDDGLPGYILFMWIFTGFMNVFSLHQLWVAVKLFRSTNENLSCESALQMAIPWRMGHATFFMSIMFDILVVRLYQLDSLLLMLPGILFCVRLGMYFTVRQFKLELLNDIDINDSGKC